MPKLLSDEQHNLLVSVVEGRTANEVSKLLNEKYCLSITTRQIQTYKKNHSLISNISTTFRKGVDPVNKGTKGVYNVGGNKTSFKPGRKPHNYKPIGSQRLNGDDYVDIKVADPNKWRGKHLVVWEKENGPVPKGHAVIFADGNRRNFELENLILISRKQLATLNKNRLIQKDADLTRTGIILADIYLKIGERKKVNN